MRASSTRADSAPRRRTASAGASVHRRTRLLSACAFGAAFSAVLLLSGDEARAVGRVHSMRGEDLVMTVDTRWTGCGQGGYYPIRIRATNRGRPRNLLFEFEPYDGQGLPVVRRRVGATRNATVNLTLAVPMVGSGRLGTLHVYADGRELEEFKTQISLADSDPASGLRRPALLVISSDVVDCAAFEKAINVVLAGAQSVQQATMGMTAARGSTSRAGSGNHQVIEPVMLPKSWIGYSGVDLVAVPLETLSALQNQERAALLQWVHCGGTLLVTQAADRPRLERLLNLSEHADASEEWHSADPEQRQRIDPGTIRGPGSGGVGAMPVPEGGAPPPQQQPEANPPQLVWPRGAFAYRDLMLGRVYAFEGNPFPGSVSDWAWFLSSLEPHRYRWDMRHGVSPRSSNPDFLKFLIPGVQGVPTYAFLALITLFTLLIGPVNYLYFWKRKQLGLLVVTIPGLALVTSLSLFGYSILAHGFGVKSRARSLTVLDQRHQTAVSTCRLALYAGLAPSELRFSPRTAVYPIWPQGGAGLERGLVDWTEAQALRSGWLRSRTRTQFLTVAHRDERGRLDIEANDNETLSVANGFPWDIDAVVVSDEDGRLYVGRGLPADASARLKPATEEELDTVAGLLERHPLKRPADLSESYGYRSMFGLRMQRMPRRFEAQGATFGRSRMEGILKRLQRLGSDADALSPRSYVAVTAENPGVALGVEETEERAHLHVLLGYY